MVTGRQTWQLQRCRATNKVGVGHLAIDVIVGRGGGVAQVKFDGLAPWSALRIASSVAGFAGWCNALQACGSRGVRGGC